MEKRRKYIRLYGYDYSKNGAYFLTLCTYDRQKLFGEEVITPNSWYKESGSMQYGEISDSPVGATPCGRPNTVSMIEKWIHKIPEKFQNVVIDYYAIMPDHVHLVLFILNDWDDHMGSPLHGNLKNKGKHTVSDVIDWFKTMTTNEYIRMVREGYLPPFQKTCENVLSMTV